MTGTTDKHNTIPYTAYHSYPEQRMLSRAEEFLGELRRRRSVRDFATRGVPRSIIEACIASAGTAPSGANQQPWYFVAVEDKEAKHSIRLAAEEEEREFYDRKAPDAWLQAIEPLGTNAEKTFLERAPWLIAVFQQRYSFDQDQRQVKHYYPAESVGLATGVLITALHHAGLACLTHTPSPMRFLNEILGRPPNERPFLLLVTGYPDADARVPDLTKKSLDQIASFV